MRSGIALSMNSAALQLIDCKNVVFFTYLTFLEHDTPFFFQVYTMLLVFAQDARYEPGYFPPSSIQI